MQTETLNTSVEKTASTLVISDRSRRESPIALELKAVNEEISPLDAIRNSSNLSFDNFNEFGDELSEDFNTFEPKLGYFGAPICRWTSSVMSLIGMMFGLVVGTTGICILIFFTNEEPTIWPLGATLLVIGILLLLLGLTMWTSEFLFNDCLGKAQQKIREAPLKNAIKRRSRMSASRASNSTNAKIVSSRCGSEVSYRTGGSNRNIITTPKY